MIFPTLGSIDSVIARGRCYHWRQLLRAAQRDPAVLEMLEEVARDGSTTDQLQGVDAALYRRWLRWCEKQRLIDELAQRAGLAGVFTRRELRRILAPSISGIGTSNKSAWVIESLRAQRSKRLSQLAALYAAGEVTWREIREETDVAFGDLLVELANQGLPLPRAIAPKTPVQEQMLKTMFNEAEKQSHRPMEHRHRHLEYALMRFKRGDMAAERAAQLAGMSLDEFLAASETTKPMRIVGHRDTRYVDAHDHYGQREVIRVIETGSWREWRGMARAAHWNPIVLSTVQRMCQMRLEHPEAGQRYARWLRWCEMQRAIDGLAQRGHLEALPRRELRRIVLLQRRFGITPTG